MLLPQEHCFNQKENKTKKHCSFLAEIHGAIFSCSELRNVSSQLFPAFSFLTLPFPMLFLFSLMMYKYSSHCPSKPCAHTSVTSIEMNFSLPIVEKCVTWNSKCIRAPGRDIIRKYERKIAH